MESDHVNLRRELADTVSFEPPTGEVPELRSWTRHRAMDSSDTESHIKPAMATRSRHSSSFLTRATHTRAWWCSTSTLRSDTTASRRSPGLVGDQWQAFGPALALARFVVVAPDSIGFEDRRHDVVGVNPHPDDWLQHYNEMAYRLLRGETLMRKVLSDAADALSLLMSWDRVDTDRVGVLGHSYGGNTVLFHAAVDDRVRFAVANGAACSFRTKFAERTPVELSLLLPGFVERFDIEDLVRAIAPRPLLLVSGEQDQYSKDAPTLVQLAQPTYVAQGSPADVTSLHYPGGHQLDQERFDAIVAWVHEGGRPLDQSSDQN